MKVQDIAFFVALIGLWFVPGRNNYLYAGLLSIVAAIPLFATWTFFTAERFIWYASAFILVHIVLQLKELKREIAL